MIHFKAPTRFAVFLLAGLTVILISGTGCQPPQEQAGPRERKRC